MRTRKKALEGLVLLSGTITCIRGGCFGGGMEIRV